MKIKMQYIPILVLLTVSIISLYFGVHKYLNFETFKANHEYLEAYIAIRPFASIAVYMVAYVVIVALSIPGAGIMTIIGGFLFGQLVGTGVVVVAATIGATILFISAKLASQEILAKKTGPWVEKMREGFQENAFFYLLTLRLIPLFPFVAINLVAAVFQIPLRTFVVATLVGIIPGTFVFLSIGSALRDIALTPELSLNTALKPSVLIALVGLAGLSLLPVIYKKMRSK
jgi:uncharacterized membrane protein YdjX (TVP38/TMEM64 family)